MTSLRIEICNERLLPRFGVDRVLVLLGRRLAHAGHQVSFVCLRCDRTMLSSVAADISILSVPEGLDMVGTEASVTAAMGERWAHQPPDIVIVGGWPFCGAAARAREFAVKSIFNDYGAVAQDGLVDPQLTIQLELRRIRQLAMPFVDRAVSISGFIRDSQTELDRGSSVGVRTVLLGADHMALGIVGSEQHRSQDETVVRRLSSLARNGRRLLLALGRFEADGYKNSPAAYDVLRKVREVLPQARLLILDAGADCKVPSDLSPFIDLLGAPDDLALQEIMKLSSAGISTSRWEGFNLPVAEMQWLGQPAFAFNLGAHPEVIADPWLLCEDAGEMAAKLIRLLRGEVPVDLPQRFAVFRDCFPWDKALGAWEQQITELASVSRDTIDVEKVGPCGRRIILVDVSNASLDPANPGVIRVVRRLCAELQRDPDFEMVFAGWNSDSEDYTFLDETRRRFLEGYSGPTDGLGLLVSRGRMMTPAELINSINVNRASVPVLFMPEVTLDGGAVARAEWAKRHGFKIATILYDLIPLHHPELCDPKISEVFPAYLDAILRTDAVWSISATTLDGLRGYAASRGRTVPSTCSAVWLPGQFGEQPRRTNADADTGEEIRILFVSTLEPRKNHLRLLEALGLLRVRRPDLQIHLVLIGNRYAGAPEIAEQVQAAAWQDCGIEWHGAIDDERLAAEFDRASFTVYPSLVEGFGLPIMESLWMGRPCLTHDGGVMRELAADGGCVTANMTDTDAIARALERMATDRGLLARLRQEARARTIKTWQDYANDVAGQLLAL
jgi:glycosyltransferase involved in cell wall biosynthesis